MYSKTPRGSSDPTDDYLPDHLPEDVGSRDLCNAANRVRSSLGLVPLAGSEIVRLAVYVNPSGLAYDEFHASICPAEQELFLLFAELEDGDRISRKDAQHALMKYEQRLIDDLRDAAENSAQGHALGAACALVRAHLPRQASEILRSVDADIARKYSAIVKDLEHSIADQLEAPLAD